MKLILCYFGLFWAILEIANSRPNNVTPSIIPKNGDITIYNVTYDNMGNMHFSVNNTNNHGGYDITYATYVNKPLHQWEYKKSKEDECTNDNEFRHFVSPKIYMRLEDKSTSLYHAFLFYKKYNYMHDIERHGESLEIILECDSANLSPLNTIEFNSGKLRSDVFNYPTNILNIASTAIEVILFLDTNILSYYNIFNECYDGIITRAYINNDITQKYKLYNMGILNNLTLATLQYKSFFLSNGELCSYELYNSLKSPINLSCYGHNICITFCETATLMTLSNITKIVTLNITSRFYRDASEMLYDLHDSVVVQKERYLKPINYTDSIELSNAGILNRNLTCIIENNVLLLNNWKTMDGFKHGTSVNKSCDGNIKFPKFYNSHSYISINRSDGIIEFIRVMKNDTWDLTYDQRNRLITTRSNITYMAYIKLDGTPYFSPILCDDNDPCIYNESNNLYVNLLTPGKEYQFIFMYTIDALYNIRRNIRIKKNDYYISYYWESIETLSINLIKPKSPNESVCYRNSCEYSIKDISTLNIETALGYKESARKNFDCNNIIITNLNINSTYHIIIFEKGCNKTHSSIINDHPYDKHFENEKTINESPLSHV